MDKAKQELLSNLHKLWTTNKTNSRVKENIGITDYNCLRACKGYILDYRSIVYLGSCEYTVRCLDKRFIINRGTLELIAAYRRAK